LVEDGTDAYTAFLTNPHAGISADKDGKVASSTEISTNVVVMKGGVPQTVKIGTITNDLFNVTIT
jgi:hypothetical protein